PSDSSGNPKRARVPQTRRWQASAISSPPPRQSPFTAAMNGFGRPNRPSSRARPARPCRTASSADGRTAIAPRSPPTEKTRGRPVTMTTRTVLGATSDRTSSSSAKSAGVRALTGGWLSRTSAVLSSTTVSISFCASAIGPAHTLQQAARGVIASTQPRLQSGQPWLQDVGIERPDLLERPPVRADDLAQDGVDLGGLAEVLGDAREGLRARGQPDPLGDVLPRGRPRRDVRLGKEREEAWVLSPASVPVQEDAALGLAAEVALGTQRGQYSPDGTVVRDQGRALSGEDVEGDIDADEIEHRQGPHQQPVVHHPGADGRRADARRAGG